MARVTCRRRSDGIFEIVPPTPWQRFLSTFRSLFISLGVVGGALLAAVLYTTSGIQSVLLAGVCVAGVAAFWRSGQYGPPVPSRSERPERRSAP
jgi:hypothetical protein